MSTNRNLLNIGLFKEIRQAIIQIKREHQQAYSVYKRCSRDIASAKKIPQSFEEKGELKRRVEPESFYLPTERLTASLRTR